jgi:uncharacterized membrane protein YbhN (UPF0104 family)
MAKIRLGRVIISLRWSLAVFSSSPPIRSAIHLSWILFVGLGIFHRSRSQGLSAMIQSVVPIPGDWGGRQRVYYIMVQIMGNAYINFAMVLWRLLTLYLPILPGLVALMLGKRKDDGVPQ